MGLVLYGLLAADDGLRTVQPVLARATHTGREGGTYATPQFHDRAFADLPINGRHEVDYRLTAVAELPREVRAHVRAHEELRVMRTEMEGVALKRWAARRTATSTTGIRARLQGLLGERLHF